jgi:hypothetical protein
MLDLVRLRIDHLVIDRCPKQEKYVREDDHQPGQDEENHRGMRDLVPYRFNAVEQSLQNRFRRRRLDDGNDASLLAHGSVPSKIGSAQPTAPIVNGMTKSGLMPTLLRMMIGHHLRDDDRKALARGDVQESDVDHARSSAGRARR